MEIIRPINRHQRRIISAEDRRANARAFGGCHDCGPRNGFGQYRAVVSSMGRMFGNEAVVRAAHSPGNAPQVQKAAQLSGLTALGLERTAPADRLTKLSEITNPQFAAEVNALAAKLPKGMNVADRANFALMIVLLPGVEEASRGIATHRSDAAVKLDRGLCAVLNGLGATPPTEAPCHDPIHRGDNWIKEACGTFNTQSNRDAKIELVKDAYWTALKHAPSNCAINYYTQMYWCSKESFVATIKAHESDRIAGRPFDPAWGGGADVQHGISGAFQAATDFFANIGDKLVEYISASAEAASAAFCKGFKALLGDTVGGIFCTIFDVLFKLISGTLKAVFAIVTQILSAITGMLAKLFRGDLKGAVIVLFQKINTVIVLAIGGPLADLLGIPFTKADARRRGKDVSESFEGLGERLTNKDMLFTVNLAMAIVNCILAATATGLTAGAAALMLRTAIGMLVMVLAEAIGIVYAPQLMKLDMLKDEPREKVESGIALTVKLTALVVMAVMTLYDFTVKLKTSVMKWVESKRAQTAKAGGVGKYLAGGADGIWSKIKDAAGSTWNALKQWPVKFKEIGDKISALVTILPILLIAIVDDGDGTLKELTEQTKAAYTQAATSWQTAQTMWNESTKNLTAQEKLKASGFEPVVRTKDEEIAYLKQQLAEVTLRLKRAMTAKAPAAPQKKPRTAAAPQPRTAAGPLVLATGGFLVGGPVGAAVGLAIGLAAGRKQAAA